MLKSQYAFAGLALSALMLVAPAQAASYDFNINYLGSGQTAVAAGSQSPDGVMLNLGDSFTYALQAQAGMAWSVNTAADYFALFALGVGPDATRTGDFSVTLSLGALPVYSWSQTGVATSYVHLGSNYVPLSQGLMFDHLSFSYSLTSAAGCAWDSDHNNCVPTGETSTSTLSGILPIFGAPESHFSGGISYVTAVPEPRAAFLMLVGLLPIAVLRRRVRRTS